MNSNLARPIHSESSRYPFFWDSHFAAIKSTFFSQSWISTIRLLYSFVRLIMVSELFELYVVSYPNWLKLPLAKLVSNIKNRHKLHTIKLCIYNHPFQSLSIFGGDLKVILYKVYMKIIREALYLADIYFWILMFNKSHSCKFHEHRQLNLRFMRGSKFSENFEQQGLITLLTKIYSFSFHLHLEIYWRGG